MPLTKIVSQGLQGSPRVSVYTISGPASYAAGGFAADITTSDFGSIDLSKSTVLVHVESTTAVYDIALAEYVEADKKIKLFTLVGEVAPLTDISGTTFVITAFSTP